MDLDTKTMIIENNKCAWGKCIFCSFSKKQNVQILSEDKLKQLIENELDGITTLKQLKFFNSGSFLDENQIPIPVQDFLLEKCKQLKTEELIFECHPMFITDKNISRIRKKLNDINYSPKINVAIGLESADNTILKKIKKGITRETYTKAVELLKKYNFYARTYLMANLPYKKDYSKSLKDSVDFALPMSDTICIINAYPYGYAELFDIWLSRKWHPLNKNEFEKITKKYKNNKKIEIFFDDFISYPKFSLPKQKKVDLYGANKFNLTHPYYEVWQEYLADFYIPPKVKEHVLILPCSYRKPYSMSKTHKAIITRLKGAYSYGKIHQIMVSNPGLIPREFESKYPFAKYDWPEAQETPNIKKLYTVVTQARIENYLKNHKDYYSYNSKKPVFCYLKYEAESYIALKNACKNLDISLINLVDKDTYDLFKKQGMKDILINEMLLDKMFLGLAKRKL